MEQPQLRQPMVQPQLRQPQMMQPQMMQPQMMQQRPPIIITESGSGGSHFGSIMLGLIVLLIIGGVAVGIYFLAKGKGNKAHKWGKDKKGKKEKKLGK